MSDQGQTPKKENWNSATHYETYVGRWSRLVASEFLNWLNVPSGYRWLDVGCGSGILTQTILDRAAPSEVTGIDTAEAFVAYAREHVTDERARFEVGDAQQLPVESGHYDAVVSGLVLNFVPDPLKAVQEMARAAEPGSGVAAYVWDYADGMQMTRIFWDTVIGLHPEAVEFDQGRRFPICKPEPLKALFENAGLEPVEVRSIDVPTHFRDFDDYWSPFLGGQGSAPSYLKSFSEPDRDALRDALQRRLPVNADGSIDLVARAWAVRGLRP